MVPPTSAQGRGALRRAARVGRPNPPGQRAIAIGRHSPREQEDAHDYVGICFTNALLPLRAISNCRIWRVYL